MTGTDQHFDIIIIGSGAAGGTMAYSLAPTGKKILILERGRYVRREKANWDSHAVNVEAKYQTKEQWSDKYGKPLHPHTNYYVGGNTKLCGAALFRLRCEDFGEIRHFGGISPAWPISYYDLEPYYLQAERLYHVHGWRGEDPTEPPANGPYPHPPISHEPRIQQLSVDFARQGLRPFHTPLGLQIDETNPVASKCIRCDTCDGYPCLVDAKSDAQVICVDPALRFPNVSLMTDSYVERLETTGSGREVSRVIVRRRGINLRHGFLTEYIVDEPEYIIRVPENMKEVGVLMEPMSVAQKAIEQACRIQQRLRVWRPKRAAVMGSGTLGLLATLVLRLRGLDVSTFGNIMPPTLNSNLIEELGARYISTKQMSLTDASAKHGPFDLILEGTGYSPLVFEAMNVLAKNGALAMVSVTGGSRQIEVPADKINLGFVLGNKVAFGSVNANREYFETGVKDLSTAELQYPGWLKRLLTHPVRGLENYGKMMRILTEAKGSIKVYCEVAAIESRQTSVAAI